MATLIISQKSKFYQGYRNVEIFIDGKNSGTIFSGKIKEFHLTAGQHTISAKTKLPFSSAGSNELQFEIREKEIQTFEVARHPFITWSSVLFFVFLIGHIIGKKYFAEHHWIYIPLWIAGVTLLCKLYLMTFKNNFYLKLKNQTG